MPTGESPRSRMLTREIVDEATHMAMEGYVNVSIDYRLYAPGCSASAGAASGCLTAITDAVERAGEAALLAVFPSRHLRILTACFGIQSACFEFWYGSAAP